MGVWAWCRVRLAACVYVLSTRASRGPTHCMSRTRWSPGKWRPIWSVEELEALPAGRNPMALHHRSPRGERRIYKLINSQRSAIELPGPDDWLIDLFMYLFIYLFIWEMATVYQINVGTVSKATTFGNIHGLRVVVSLPGQSFGWDENRCRRVHVKDPTTAKQQQQQNNVVIGKWCRNSTHIRDYLSWVARLCRSSIPSGKRP